MRGAGRTIRVRELVREERGRDLVRVLLPLTAQALLTVLFARALGGLVSVVALLTVLVAASVLGRVSGASRLRGWVVFAIAAAGVFTLRWAVLSGLSLLAAYRASAGGAAFLQQADTVSLVALPVVALGFLGGYLARRVPQALRWEPLVHGILLLALLWSQAHYSLTYFQRPWTYVLIVGLLLAADLLLLARLDLLGRRVLLRLAVLLVPLVAAALFLSVQWYSLGGTAAGGGILRPTLFRFDFAPYVQLESEISMSDDLVLLYRRSGRPRRELIRRYVLSDYDPRRGFSVAQDASPGARDPADDAERELVEQEYFLVNLDPGTRLALNAPLRFQRFASWDDSSFTVAYRAESLVSTAPPFRLARVEDPGLSPSELERLTDHGENQAIQDLAREITDGIDGPFARARAIELYLQENYYYSLRPGIAADSDQLSHFLFQSRKGYCSYYAFSMALMVRSLGIPARVAVGFFVDPGQEVLNFYPVLANMAHAWVEVYLGEYGWISFDPTSQTLAPGEEYEVGAGADPEELAALLEEILGRELRPADEPSAVVEEADADFSLPQAVQSVLGSWYLLLPGLYLLYLTVLRLAPLAAAAFSSSPRRRTLIRVRALLRRFASCGYRRRADESLARFGNRVPVRGARALIGIYERALFAPSFDEADEYDARARITTAACGLREAVGLPRCLVALLDPRIHRGPAAEHRAGKHRTPEHRTGEPRAHRHHTGEPGARANGGTSGSPRISVWLALPFALVLSLLGALAGGAPPLYAQDPPVPTQEQPLQEAPASAAPAAGSPEWYREEARAAIRAERYDRAVQILKEAQREHGERAEFYLRLGDLYYDEELYELALDEYLAAERYEPRSYRVLESVAFTLGLLNREDESAQYWRRMAELYPDRIEPRQNLAWLLFKLHRLEEGRELIREAWEVFGPDADLAMTMGTIHAELYELAGASEWYKRSIELAATSESESFVAVAYYNLSLIQKLFHRYEDALESTEQSLAMLPRPTGYLARGELHELRMDFSAAHGDYMRAYEMDDDTPLARLNLAILYQRFGRLEDALAFARSVVEEQDRSWLYYYGTDVRRHQMELHDLLADIHDGLARVQADRLAAGPLDWFRRTWDRLRHRVLGWYHRARFRRAAAAVAEQVIQGGNLIDGNWYLYRAADAHSRVALEYLRRARELEVSAIPQAEWYYAVREAELRGRTGELLQLASRLDSPWQRHLREEALVAALERRRPGREAQAARAAVDLYAINPGALPQHGVPLPVAVEVQADRTRDARAVGRMLGRVGFVTDAPSGAPVVRLSVTLAPERLEARLLVAGQLVTAEAERTAPGRPALRAAVNELAASLFAVQ